MEGVYFCMLLGNDLNTQINRTGSAAGVSQVSVAVFFKVRQCF